MLTNALIMTTIPEVNIKRESKFYSETSGLKVSKSGEGEVFLECRATKADHNVAGFIIQDVEAEVKEAWFKDTEGNILAVDQES